VPGPQDAACTGPGLLMELVIARGALLEQILDSTYPIWHEGLTRKAYGQWNAAQMLTPWGAERLHRLALVDEANQLLATAKRYRYDVRMGDRTVPMCGIGAVFTPPELRGRGHATALIERLIEKERTEGAAFAALFSEIDPSFYERLSFRRLPIDEVTVSLKSKAGTPAMLVRAGVERDLPALAAMHDVRSSAARFAVRRDASLIGFSLAKKRLLAGLGPPGLRHLEFYVAEEGASAVAYVILSVNAHGWTLDEFGDRDPAGARFGAILHVLTAREPSRGVPLIRTWWPPIFPVPPQLTLEGRTSARDVLMMRPLADVESPSRLEEIFYWRSDFF
jgi:GNAT superfamily N-acetyltransferase